MLSARQDAYGAAIFDHLEGHGGEEIVERDNGFFYVGAGPELYFARFPSWRAHERAAMRHVRGRVLDVGCGAGRVALHLIERGHEVAGIDVSPLAIETCRLRGLAQVEVRSIVTIGRDLGTFDTIVMAGSNFGLFGSRERAHRLLRRMASITPATGRIVASTRDPHMTAEEEDRRYMERNVRRGRTPGQWRIRIRYRDRCTPWFDHLTVSEAEMGTVLDATRWRIAKVLPGPNAGYAVVLEKT